MLSIEEQKSIVEKFVRANKNFSGNEDLFDDFCSEALQKSYLIFNSANNIQKVESYISKVVHTSILQVLKEYGRVRRDKTGYVPVKEVKTADLDNISAVRQSLKEPEAPAESFSAHESAAQPAGAEDACSFISSLPDPGQTAEDDLITRECLQRIADTVCIINKEAPSEKFLDLFKLRYMKGMKQAQIAAELGISQSEASRRLMKMSKLISSILNRGRSQVEL